MSDAARDACAERCAEFGDPPCWEIHEERHGEYIRQTKWKPCDECLREVGVEVPEPLDPGAVIAPLL